MKTLEQTLFLLDKKGKKIKIGDILKTTKAGRKEYKQVISEVSRFSNDKSFFLISNLTIPYSSYHLKKDNLQHDEIEIVQSSSEI